MWSSKKYSDNYSSSHNFSLTSYKQKQITPRVSTINSSACLSVSLSNIDVWPKSEVILGCNMSSHKRIMIMVIIYSMTILYSWWQEELLAGNSIRRRHWMIYYLRITVYFKGLENSLQLSSTFGEFLHYSLRLLSCCTSHSSMYI